MWLIIAVLAFFVTCILSTIIFVCVEKPGINARIMIKSKWTNADLIKKPVEAKPVEAKPA